MGAIDVSMRAVGDWNKKMDVPLHNALQASIQMTGRTGRQACEWAIILMAKSARASTPQARKKRKRQKDEKGEYWQKPWKSTKIYRWMYSDTYNGYFKKYLQGKTWEEGLLTSNRGLAKRSWFWGLGNLSSSSRLKKSKEMQGVNTLQEVHKMASSGYILTNRLNYIKKITPPGFENDVAKKATNVIMAQVAKKMEKKYGMVIPRLAASRAKRAKTKLDREFKRRQAA